MKLLFTFLLSLLLNSSALAATIHFKDGRTISGKILQQDSSLVKIDLNGLAMTYYVDEIKDIDGKVMESFVSKSSAHVVVKPTVSLVPQFPLITPDDPVEKRTLMLKFIDVFGTRSAMTRNLEAMLNSIEQQNPLEAKKIRDNFKVDEVIERLIPLYDKHFSSDELKAYIDFYSSYKGKKLITSVGEIMKESVEVSANYLKEKFPEIAGK